MTAGRPVVLHPSCPSGQQRASKARPPFRALPSGSLGAHGFGWCTPGPHTLLGPSRSPPMVLVHAAPVLTAAALPFGNRQAKPTQTEPPPRLAGSLAHILLSSFGTRRPRCSGGPLPGRGRARHLLRNPANLLLRPHDSVPSSVLWAVFQHNLFLRMNQDPGSGFLLPRLT